MHARSKLTKCHNIFVVVVLGGVFCLTSCHGTQSKGQDEALTYTHRLDDAITLKYSEEEIEYQDDIDFLLASIMRKLWTYDYQEPISDFYWQWTQDVSSMIDSLYHSKNLFSDPVLDRYDKAAEVLKSYLDCTGTQYEMNNVSYVIAAIDLYKVHKKNIDFAEIFDYVDMYKEYQLYSQYMEALESWEAMVSRALGEHHSAKPLEDNVITTIRCEDRGHVLEDMIDVNKGLKLISANNSRPSRDMIKKKYHENIPVIYIEESHREVPGPIFNADTLGIYLLQWADYRDSIADKMPSEIGRSYKNQTTNLILDMMKLTKPDPDNYEYNY